MLNEINNVRLSPVLGAILAASTTLSLSKPARGETADLALPSLEAAMQEGETIPLETKVSDIQRSLVGENLTLPPMEGQVWGFSPQIDFTVRESFLAQNQSSLEKNLTLPLLGEPVWGISPQLDFTVRESSLAQNQSPDPSNEVPVPPQLPEASPQLPEAPPPEPQVLVGEVLVSGADKELTDLVYNAISIQPGRTTTRSRLQEDVEAIYATGYFANVKVTPEDTPLGVRITFAVEPNPILNQVVIETLPATEKERALPQEVADEIFSDRYGKILNLRDLQEDIKELTKWYTENGYDLAQVVGSPEVAEDGIVTLVVAEGVIGDIQVRFFDEEDEPVEEWTTRDFIVTREMQLKPGDVFNRNTAQRDLQRVFGLGIFEDARLSFSPGADPSEVVVNIDVVEGSTGSFAAGAGVSSTSGLFGTVSFQQQNVGGNNQTIATEVQVGTRELLFDASFTDPWIGGDPHRTAYTVNGFRRRSISLVYDGGGKRTIRTENGNNSPRIVRTGGGITFSRPLADNPYTRPDWRLSTGLQYQNIRVENADGDLAPRSREVDGNKKLAFNRNGVDDLVIFKLSASQDNRNNPLQPTSGSLLRLGMDQTVPTNSGSNIIFNRLRGSYSFYIPVQIINFDFTEGPQAFAFNVQSGTVLGDLPPYEAFVLGGSNSVRGYGEGNLASGRSYFQATAEYRFPIISFFRGAIFVDYGTDLGSSSAVRGNPSSVRNLPRDGVGYGIGVRVDSPLGPLRLDYAFDRDGEGRVHFGIGEKF